jgi:uncharacterized protein YbbK (DUF523 family)
MVSCITFAKKTGIRFFVLLNSPMCGIDDTKVYTVVLKFTSDSWRFSNIKRIINYIKII